jgi:hypothetical protein
MELEQLHSSHGVRAQYFKALAKLAEQLNETWKKVFPSEAVWRQFWAQCGKSCPGCAYGTGCN